MQASTHLLPSSHATGQHLALATGNCKRQLAPSALLLMSCRMPCTPGCMHAGMSAEVSRSGVHLQLAALLPHMRQPRSKGTCHSVVPQQSNDLRTKHSLLRCNGSHLAQLLRLCLGIQLLASHSQGTARNRETLSKHFGA